MEGDLLSSLSLSDILLASMFRDLFDIYRESTQLIVHHENGKLLEFKEVQTKNWNYKINEVLYCKNLGTKKGYILPKIHLVPFKRN